MGGLGGGGGSQLAIVVAGDAKERVEDDLARVQEALAVAEESRCKVKAQTSCLEVEQTSDLLELGPAKDKVAFLHS